MKFLLQSDDVMLVEKRAISHMAALRDNYIVKRASLQDIYNGNIPGKDYVPVGTVEFTKAYAKVIDVDIDPISSYPRELQCFLHRTIRADFLSRAEPHEFVKPVLTKVFTGGIKKNLADADNIPGFTPVWVSEPVHFVSEWRYYILNHKIVGCGRYDDGIEEDSAPCQFIVSAAVKAMHTENISGYSLDVGRLSNGLTALVEVNDAWALGYYSGTCSTESYAQLIHTRWQQIIC